LIGIVLGMLIAVALGPVVLRDGTRYEASDAKPFTFTEQGVQVDVEPDLAAGVVPVRRLVGWAEVANIEGGWGDAERFRAVSDAVDRSEKRLARGDVTGARALLEPLADQYLNDTGPTSGSVASMLAFCRVLRDDRAGAAEAWLAWRRGGTPARDWIDAETGLTPAIPPVWTPADAREAATLLSPMATDASGDDPATELVRLYAMSAVHAAGGQIEGEYDGPETRMRADAGVRLVWEMVRAQTDPEAAGRRGAREALRRRARTPGPAWQTAWVHLGLGASLLREPERIEADAGAAELLTVVLLHQDAAPGLAELAADLAVEYFEQTGRAGHAQAVREMDAAAISGLLPAARPDEDGTGSGPEPMTEPTEETP
jgi:hypothetical protein